MRGTVTTVTASEGLPITLTAAKNHLRITNNLEDAYITELVRQATDMVETYLRRSLITKSLKLTLDRPPFSANSRDWWDGMREGSMNDLYCHSEYIELPFPPLISITTFAYYTSSDTSATLSSDNYFADSAGGRVCLKQGGQWPSDLRSRKSIEITYQAGYGTAPSDIPPTIQAGIRAVVANLYTSRDCPEMPDSAKSLLNPYRILHEMRFS